MSPPRPNGRDEGGHRPRPYKPEVEQALLGAVMINNGKYERVAAIVGPDHFGNAMHGRIFAEIGQRRAKGRPATPVTLKEWLAQDEEMRGADAADYLKGLANEGQLVFGSPEDFAREVREDADKRGLIDAAEYVIEEVRRGAKSPAEIGEEVAKRLPHANGAAEKSTIPELQIDDAGDIDLERTEPREWVLGNRYCLGFVSGNIGNGGVGKTALAIVDAVSISSGRSLTDEHLFRQENVLVVCLEDHRKEIRRRVKAALLHHRVDPTQVKDRLFYCAHKGEKMMVRDARGVLVAGNLGPMIRAAVARYQAKVVIVEPLIKAHSVDENSNVDMDAVVDAFVGMAEEEQLSIMLTQHTRKGTNIAGDADIGRGATAVKNGARLVYTTVAMTEKEQALYGLDTKVAKSLIRVDSAKVNICPPELATWFKLVGVKLGNGTEMYPNGDDVQTVERWTPPDTFAGVSSATWCVIIDEIDAGMATGQRYSAANNATDRAAWKIVVKHLDRTEQQARAIINTWVKKQVLAAEDYYDPVERKELKGLKADPAKRPGNERSF